MDDRKGVPLREDLLAADPRRAVRPGPRAGAPQRARAARPARRAADRVRGRRGLGQDHPGPADLHLAARAGLRRGDHPRARRDQDRDAAAGAAAGHRAHRHVAAGRGADVRGRPRRARRPRSSRPALDRGAIVITDRYVDSSLAYQGAGRNLPVEEIARLNWWATGGRDPGPDHPAGHGPDGRAEPPGPFGRPAGSRARRFPPAGPGRVPGPGPRRSRPLPGARRRPAGRRDHPGIQNRIRGCSPIRSRRSPRRPPATSPPSRKKSRDRVTDPPAVTTRCPAPATAQATDGPSPT